MMGIFLFGLSAFVLTVIATGVTLRVLKHYHIMDNPSARSSHIVPQFRGGGWGVMLPCVALVLLAGYLSNSVTQSLWLAASITILMAVSWLDDMKQASAKLRFAVQIIAVLFGYQALPDTSLLYDFVPRWLEYIIVGIGWLWFINLYNFMDGIDGITGTQTAFIGTGVIMVSLLAVPADTVSPLLGAVLVGCGLGFLVWNWHPSKLFMGDIGSIPLGFICGFLLLKLAANGQLGAAMIIPLYYVADATFTILKRALKGERIWEAHRQHFYQQALAHVGKGHNHVVHYIIACNVLLLVCAFTAIYAGWLALIPAAVAVTALFLALQRRGSLARQALQPQ